MTKENIFRLVHGEVNEEVTADALREFLSFMTSSKELTRRVASDYLGMPEATGDYLAELLQTQPRESFEKAIQETGIEFTQDQLIEMAAMARYFSQPENQHRLDEIVSGDKSAREILQQCKKDMLASFSGENASSQDHPLELSSFQNSRLKMLKTEAESLGIRTSVIADDDLVIVKAGLEKKAFSFRNDSVEQLCYHLVNQIKDTRKAYVRYHGLEECFERFQYPPLDLLNEKRDDPDTPAIFWGNFFNVYAAIFTHLGGKLKEHDKNGGFSMTIHHETRKDSYWELGYDRDGLIEMYRIVLAFLVVEAQKLWGVGPVLREHPTLCEAVDIFSALVRADGGSCCCRDRDFLFVRRLKFHAQNDPLGVLSMELMAIPYEVETLYEVLKNVEVSLEGQKDMRSACLPLTQSQLRESKNGLPLKDWQFILNGFEKE